MYSVYKITNLINGKLYIGQTIQKVSYRWYDHKCIKKSKNINVLRSAIKKYGVDNFKVEVIEENLTSSEANKLEIKLIKQLNTLAPNGYNLASGGKNFRHSKITKIKISKAQKHKMNYLQVLVINSIEVWCIDN